MPNDGDSTSEKIIFRCVHRERKTHAIRVDCLKISHDCVRVHNGIVCATKLFAGLFSFWPY